MHPDDAEWDAWTPAEVADRLRGVDVPWYVAAGWAIDLFLGAQRREHEDLELGVPANRFGKIAAAFGDLEFHVVGPGLTEPVEQVRELMETTHQTWALDRTANVWRLDVFREPTDGEHWICRRDGSIHLRYDELIERSADGIPYARPEVVLLFKAKGARPKDESDFAAVLPHLGADRRQLLAGWIAQVHPGHFWLADLA